MSFVDVVLPGRYWDSILYAGRLYLFHRDGTFRVVNWDQLIRELRYERELDGTLRFLLSQSDYLYAAFGQRRTAQPLVDDLASRLAKLEGVVIEITEQHVAKATIAHVDNLFPFPHAASLIYRGTLYVGSKSGIAQCPNITSDEGRVATTYRMWDGPAVDLAAKYGSLAVAAGSEGLWEMPIGYDTSHFVTETAGMHEWSNLLSTTCSWIALGLFGSSREGSRYIRFHADDDDGYHDATKRTVAFQASQSDIFGSAGFTWGELDRFCQQLGDKIEVVRFAPQARREMSRYRRRTSIFLDESVLPIAAEVGYFGIVLEHDNGMLLVTSANEQLQFDHEPVNWRVFNESKHYCNHLHIVRDEELHILAFTHDFDQDQRSKIAGLRFRERRAIDVRWAYLLDGR